MNRHTAPLSVYCVVEPVDMRLGAEGLSQRLQINLKTSPCNGNAYAFRNKNGTRIKLLIWDGTGVWLSVRRLHKGRFVWPQSHDSVAMLSQDDWQWLTTGIDWQRLSAVLPADWQV